MKPTFSVIFLGTFLASTAVPAGELERVLPVRDAMTAQECGECHMAFQPALLPAASWTRIMDGLQNHFGDDASLPSEVTIAIRNYLAAHAGRTGDPGTLRVTGQPWFAQEHRFSPRVWQQPAVKVKSNCVACHTDADQGLYEDD